MTPTADMMQLALDSRALTIWNRNAGPVFWYAAGVPGPFYLNTEMMIGKALSATLLERVTAIVAATTDAAARAAQLNRLILDAHAATPVFQSVIQALAAKAYATFARDSYDLISGGERRDWLFSIPLAEALGKRHAFLFKNKTLYGEQGIKSGERALHVADLINNAASYFDAWLPIMAAHDARCVGTLAVNVRGDVGFKRLTEAGYAVAALNRIDLNFFAQSLSHGFIDQATYDELALFFASPRDWADRYLMGRGDLFDVANLDAKSRERLRSFFTLDPWGLRPKHEDFFQQMMLNP